MRQDTPIFEELFIESGGQPIEYGGRTIVMMDRIPVSAGQSVRVVWESVGSEWRQGISVRTAGRLSVNEVCADHFVLWQDSSPGSVVVLALETDGRIEIKNVWDVGDGVTHSWHNGAAMFVENLENGRRYHCNDGHPDDDFDDLVFRVEH